MIEFEVTEVKMEIGKHAGKTMYGATPKVNQRYTAQQLEDYVVKATSLGRGDVRNAIASIAEFVYQGLEMGISVELGDLGMIKVMVGTKLVETPAEVTTEILKTPVVRFFPKQKMRDAARSVKRKVVNQYTKSSTETASPSPSEAV